MVAAVSFAIELEKIRAVISVLTPLAPALLALVGVVLGLYATSLLERRKHAADLRRQVLFDAAEAISTAVDYLNNIPYAFIDDFKLRSMLDDYNKKAGKLDLVANLLTIETAYKFRHTFLKITAEMGALRADMMSFKNKAELFQKRLDEHRDVMVHQIRNRNPISEDQLAAFSQNEKDYIEKIKHAALRTSEISKSLYRIMQKHSAELAESQDNFNLAAKRELGFKTDSRAYRELSALYTKSHREMVETILNEMQEKGKAETDTGETGQDFSK